MVCREVFMTTGAYNRANVVAILGAARAPRMFRMSSFSGAPTSGTSGVSLIQSDSDGVLFCLYLLACREDVAKRTVRVSENSFLVSQTYTVYIDGSAAGNQVTYTAGALDDWEDVVDGLIADLPAKALADAAVTMTKTGSATAGWVLEIKGKAEADYTVDWAATGGATVTMTAEPTSAEARFYNLMRGTDINATDEDDWDSSWAFIANSDITLDYRGKTDRLDVAGYERVYVEVYSEAGPIGDGALGGSGAITYEMGGVWFGPCILESGVV